MLGKWAQREACRRAASWRPRVFSELDLYRLGVMTIGWIMELFMKIVELSSQCRVCGKWPRKSPQLTFLLLLLPALFISQSKTSFVIVPFSCFTDFFLFPFLPPLKRRGWWVVEELALFTSYRTRFLMGSGHFWRVTHVDPTALTSQMG